MAAIRQREMPTAAHSPATRSGPRVMIRSIAAIVAERRESSRRRLPPTDRSARDSKPANAQEYGRALSLDSGHPAMRIKPAMTPAIAAGQRTTPDDVSQVVARAPAALLGITSAGQGPEPSSRKLDQAARNARAPPNRAEPRSGPDPGCPPRITKPAASADDRESRPVAAADRKKPVHGRVRSPSAAGPLRTGGRLRSALSQSSWAASAAVGDRSRLLSSIRSGRGPASAGLFFASA